MKRVTGQQVFLIGVLLLTACLAMSCRNADSGASDTPPQSGMMHAQAGGEQLQQVTLRITGMS
jgi:hypothetical protein